MVVGCRAMRSLAFACCSWSRRRFPIYAKLHLAASPEVLQRHVLGKRSRFENMADARRVFYYFEWCIFYGLFDDGTRGCGLVSVLFFGSTDRTTCPQYRSEPPDKAYFFTLGPSMIRDRFGDHADGSESPRAFKAISTYPSVDGRRNRRWGCYRLLRAAWLPPTTRQRLHRGGDISCVARGRAGGRLCYGTLPQTARPAKLRGQCFITITTGACFAGQSILTLVVGTWQNRRVTRHRRRSHAKLRWAGPVSALLRRCDHQVQVQAYRPTYLL